MFDHFRNRLFTVWLVLMLATGMAGWLADSHSQQRWTELLIIFCVLVKVHLIMSYFMELNRAPGVWRMAFSTWLCAVLGILVFVSSR